MDGGDDRHDFLCRLLRHPHRRHRAGTLFTSLFAGLASSTALTLHFSRLSQDNRVLSPLLAAGILIACGTMFPRILVVCLALNPGLLPALTPPVLVMDDGALRTGPGDLVAPPRQAHRAAAGAAESAGVDDGADLRPHPAGHPGPR
ncbi:MAG: DUF4010 domain-containing protein [Arhodomonas sp.]|nr:DUF4010 domain-containing protein [Arhodomonas sp.]